jgi:hypothetical protein
MTELGKIIEPFPADATPFNEICGLYGASFIPDRARAAAISAFAICRIGLFSMATFIVSFKGEGSDWLNA